MRAGAAAYLSKDRPGEELMAAIRKAARGGTYVTETLADQVLRAPQKAEKLPHETLTAREYQIEWTATRFSILALVASGSAS